MPQKQHQTRDWYDDPLTYDIVHAPGTRAEALGLERIERRFSLAPSRPKQPRVWFEPACGTGRYLLAAARRGKRVIGIDLNPRMITFARRAFREAGLKADLRAADMTQPPTTAKEASVDFAFCLINSIRHLPTDRAMLGHLRAVRALVRPGGLYCVGIGLTHHGAEFPTEAVFTASRAGVRVTQLAQFLVPSNRAEPVINHITVETGRGPSRRTHHFDNTYTLRCYSGTQWTAMVERAGWEIVGVVDEDGNDAPLFAGQAYRRSDLSAYGLFVLRRPSAHAAVSEPGSEPSTSRPRRSKPKQTPRRAGSSGNRSATGASKRRP